MSNYENAIELKNVTKRYDGFTLDKVSFNVPKGCIMGFIGQNGAGKTTTIKSLLHIINIDEGEIGLLGLDHIKDETEIKKHIAAVFDELPFHDMFTARDMARIFEGIYPEWDNDTYKSYLERFELPVKKKIGQFSKGMKMKLSIICAISHHPDILILDEATTGLDPVVRDEILDLFLDFIQDEKHSILFSTHITSDIQKIADYVVLIHNGKLIFEKQKDEMIYNYGIIRCKKADFNQINPDDYLIFRETTLSMECLVRDREAVRKKYSNFIIDNAPIEDIMLFYIKGDSK